MSYEKTNLKETHRAMKILRDGLKKAQKAHAARMEDNAQFASALRQKYPTEQYSQAYYNSVIYPKLRAETEAHNAQNRQAFVDAMGKTTGEMLEAIQTLKEANDFKKQALDFNDTNLLNALKMIDIYGKQMPYSEQRNLCLTFSGDMPALQALEHKMTQNGMAYASIAKKMQARFSNDFLDELTHIVYALDPEARGAWTGESYMTWINRELDEKAEIYGLDLETDPYREQIRNDVEKDKSGSEMWRDQEKRSEQRKLLKKWEAELQSMEAEGKTEEANRAAKQIVDIFQGDGFKFRE